MTTPSDIRDETCTNLSILLKLLIRNIKPGEPVQFIVSKKQVIQIEEILSKNGIGIHEEKLHQDLLLTVAKPNPVSTNKHGLGGSKEKKRIK